MLNDTKSQAASTSLHETPPESEPHYVGSRMSQEDQKTWVAVTRLLEQKFKRPVQREDYVTYAQTKAGKVIHHLFEWDDSKAAHEHRLAQAGYYCQAVQVMIGDHRAKPMRAIVNVTRADGARGMTTADNLSTNTEYRENFLEQVAREAKYFVERARMWRTVLGSDVLREELRKFGVSLDDNS